MTARPTAPAGDLATTASARRRLAVDALGIALSAGAFGVVYGLAARSVGLSLAEALAMSTIVLAGASQFAALGLIAGGVAWPAILLLTFLINARHLLYSAALAPWFQRRSGAERAVSAHVLTDETFALSLAHFRGLGHFDRVGYWIIAAFDCLPWIGATLIGYLGGQALPDPANLGLDVVFPAAMAGLAVALIAGRREAAAALAAALIGVGVALLTQPQVGIVAGGLLGPLVGFLVPARSDELEPGSALAAGEALPEVREPPAEMLP